MLGATVTGAAVDQVSVPPRPDELTANGLRDWKTGVELIRTCMDTYDTATCVIFIRYCFISLIVIC